MVSGLVLLDKPSGPTSFDCVEEVGKIYGVKKTGHTGTLDPKVTGVLLILAGEARKLAPLLENADKTYTGIMYLHNEVPEETLIAALKEFEGEITQRPPKLSRVKRVERQRKIYYIKLEKIEGREITLTIKCEHGTYIRKLFHDIGEKLETGAHMKYLRRIEVDKFSIKDCATIEEIRANPEKYIISNERIIDLLGLKKVVLSKHMENATMNGMPVDLENPVDFKEGEKVAIFIESSLRAIALVKNGQALIERVILSK